MSVVDGEQFVDEATSRNESVHHSPSAHHCKLITTCVKVQTEEINSIACANDQEDDERDVSSAFNLCPFRLMPPKPKFSLFPPTRIPLLCDLIHPVVFCCELPCERR
jgi:hypothetical protein